MLTVINKVTKIHCSEDSWYRRPIACNLINKATSSHDTIASMIFEYILEFPNIGMLCDLSNFIRRAPLVITMKGIQIQYSQLLCLSIPFFTCYYDFCGEDHRTVVIRTWSIDGRLC
jgi:hypothetical protein